MFEAVLYVETLSAAAMQLMVVEKKGEKNGRLELGMSSEAPSTAPNVY